MATVSKLMVQFVKSVKGWCVNMRLHIEDTNNSSQLLDQLMNCVYEGRKEAHTTQARANLDGPNQEGPAGLVRNPQSLPSLFRTVTSVKLDV